MDFLEILELCITNLVMTDGINHKKWQFLSRDHVSSQQCRGRTSPVIDGLAGHSQLLSLEATTSTSSSALTQP